MSCDIGPLMSLSFLTEQSVARQAGDDVPCHQRLRTNTNSIRGKLSNRIDFNNLIECKDLCLTYTVVDSPE